MIQNNFELYERVRNLCSTLSENGFERESETLRDAMSVSNVAGEILVEIYREVAALQRNQSLKFLGLSSRFDEVLRYIEQALGAV